MPNLDEILSSETQEQLAEYISAVCAQRYGEIRIVIEQGAVKFLQVQYSFSVGPTPPDARPAAQIAGPASPVRSACRREATP
jgi:hypothetical protein